MGATTTLLKRFLQLPADAIIASSKKLSLKISESVMRDPHVADKFYPYKPYQRDYILLKSGGERSGLGLPTPTQELWMGYGPTIEDFLNSGNVDVQKMKKILGSVGFHIQDGNRVLDLGCASGRMIRCHRSVQNRPVVIESKPATFMFSKGFEVTWQVASAKVGFFMRSAPRQPYV